MYIALVLIIIVSGCFDPPQETKIISKDMLVIKTVDVYPSKNVQPGDTIIIRMEVENVGQESTYLLVDKNANKPDSAAAANQDWNGDYLLIDHCPSLYRADDQDADFQILSGGTCATITTSTPLVKDSGGAEIDGNACYLKIPPGQSHTFQWSMKAPLSDKIADMTHKCTFKFQISYAATAITNTYVYFANPIEVAQRLYTQKDMTLVGDNIASYGPVAVNFAPAEPQPIPARVDSDGTPDKWTVFLNLKNVGNGITDVSNLTVALPNGVETYIENNIDKCFDGGILDVAEITHKLYLLGPDILYDQTVRERFAAIIHECIVEKLQDPFCNEKYITEISKYVTQNDGDPTNDLEGGCADAKYKSFCYSQHKEIKTRLLEQMNLLQIYSTSSSRFPCELTIPKDVVILTPFRFVTTADYTYSIRQDIQITTKPIRERA